MEMEWDVFICHANEDKEDFVRSFAESLRDAGLKVWYDEFSLKAGDRLRRSIDEGLKRSSYGIVVLSTFFFEKHWPPQELDGLAQLEVGGRDVIIPVWHNLGREEIVNHSPMLADRMAIPSSLPPNEVVKEVLRVVRGEDAAAQYDTVGPIRRLLRSKASTYELTCELLSPTEMKQLYVVRERITNLTEVELRLLLHSNLAGNGPAWYWYREVSRQELIAKCAEAIEHRSEAVRAGAAKVLAVFATRQDFGLLERMVPCQDSAVTWAGVEAMRRLATHDDYPAVMRLTVEHRDMGVREAGQVIAAKVATREDLPWLRGQLCIENRAAREAAACAIERLATRDDVPLLLDMLESDMDDVRAPAVRALGRLQVEPAVDMLAKRAESGRNQQARNVRGLISLDRRLYCPFDELKNIGEEE